MRGSPQLRGSIFEHSLRFCIILDSIYDYTSKRFCKGLLFLQCPPCAFSSSVRKQIFFKHSTLNYQHRFMCFPLRFFCRLKRKKILWIKMVNEQGKKVFKSYCLPMLWNTWFQGHCRNCLFVFVSARSDKMQQKGKLLLKKKNNHSLLSTASARGGRQ